MADVIEIVEVDATPVVVVQNTSAVELNVATGAPGPAGPANVLSMGSIATGAAGSSALATITGTYPNQVLNLTLPRGDNGAIGPANTLTIGTVASGTAAATITGTAPNQVLNLTLPPGPGVTTGGAIGAVLSKVSAANFDTNWVPTASTATASAIVKRTAAGDFDVNTPTATTHPARKDYVDTQIATRATTAHTHTAANISDSTPVGRSVLMAADAAAARTAIGAGSSNLVLGTAAGTAAAGNDARLSDARTPTAHTHTAAQISDASAVGRSVITATDAAAARAAIGAGTGSSSLAIGTTSTTAAAGDHTHADLANATNTSAPSVLVKRDASGNASFNQLDIVAALPASVSHATRKDYVDGLWMAPPTNRVTNRHWGSGTAFPTGINTRDTFYHDGLYCLMRYNGTAWRQAELSNPPTKAARDAIFTTYSASLHAGFEVRNADTGTRWEWDGAGWSYISGGPRWEVSDNTATGIAQFAYGANFTPVFARLVTKGDMANVELTVSVKTTAINVAADGNIANTVLGAIAVPYRPVVTSVAGVAATGPMLGGYIAGNGNVTIASYAPNGVLSVGAQVNPLTSWYPVADPNLLY